MYGRSKSIEDRLNAVLQLIRNGQYSTPTLADALDVSRPTISRCLAALRERGHRIRAVRNADGWAFEITSDSDSAAQPAREAR